MKKIILSSVLLFVTAILFATTIYDIQYTTDPGPDNTYPSPLEGQTVTVEGIVTAIGFGGYNDNFFISMPEGGAWKGLYIYYASDTTLVVGDIVEIEGEVTEYYGFTEITFPTSVILLSSGNPVPDPIVVTCADLQPEGVGEPYESVLIELHDVVVVEEQDPYGQWYVTDGTGIAQIDDGFFYLDEVVPPIVIILGMEWAIIRGMLDYSYDEYGLNPRTPDDLIEPGGLNADFTADPLTGIAPLQVQFTDASSGNITSWEWDFENDGTIDSYLQNPIHTYTEVGIYTVSLTVGDGVNEDTEIKEDYITVIEYTDYYSLEFDGVDDYVDIPNSPELSGMSALTVQTWINKNDIICSNGNIVSKFGTGPNYSDYSYSVYEVDGEDLISFYIKTTSGAGGTTFPSTDLNANTWHNIVGSYDGDSLKIYLDGVLKSTNSALNGDILVSNENLYFGKCYISNNYFFEGKIDEIYIWDYALTQQEIQDNMYTQLSGNELGLIGYWKFDEGSGDIVYDSTVNGNDGTIYGATWSTDVPFSGITADFEADVTFGDAPLEVHFTDLSIGDIIEWMWDFDNDGTIDSNEQNPVYIYIDAGVYTVSLTVSDGVYEDTEIKEDYIAVIEPLNADFEADVTLGDEPLEVHFTDLSTGDIIGWMWDFDNDGTIDSNEQNPVYIYNDAGIYTVSLTITDGTNEDTEIKEDYIEVTGTGTEHEIIPVETMLFQNHPNPFNPITNIQFDIKENETGVLSIYNTKGQIIESLQFEAGQHNFNWNASEQSSGVYFYKLQTDSFIEIRKMILLK